MERGIKKKDKIREIKNTLSINLIILFILFIFILVIIGIFIFLILKPPVEPVPRQLEGELGTAGPISAEGINLINSCMNITSPGDYVLTANLNESDIPSTGCFNITVSDVVLNCNGFFIRNTTLSKPGIFAANVSNITLKNCNVTMSTGGYGVYFKNVNNSVIYNTIANSNAYGIYLTLSFYNNLTLDTTSFNRIYGIYLFSSSNNILDKVSAAYNDQWNIGSLPAVNVYSGSNNTIQNSNISNNNVRNDFGIQLSSSSNNRIIDNTLDLNGYGIYLYACSYTNITNNNMNSSNYGILLSRSINNSIIGNNVNSCNTGIYLYSGSNNNFINNNIWNCTGNSIYLISKSQNNTFTGGLINLSAGNLIFLQTNSSNNLFKDMTLLGAAGNDTMLISSSINNTFLNVSYNISKEIIITGSDLTRKWYLDINVNDGINPLNQATIDTYDGSNLLFSSLTDTYGNARQELTEYLNIGIRIRSLNYSLNVSKSGYYDNVDSVEMNANKNIQMTLLSLPPSTTYFVLPTPVNEYSSTDTTIPINISIYKPNLDEIKFNWNGINYVPYDKSLALMYNFDNRNSLGESSTLVKDLSKYGNDGDVNNAVWTTSGKYGGAYSFNTTNYIQATTTNFPIGNNSRTMAGWVYINSYNGVDSFNESIFFAYGSFGTLYAIYDLYTEGLNKKLKFSQWGNNVMGTTTLNTNQWYFIAVTNIGNNVILYVNGNQDGTGTVTINTITSGNDFYIGKANETYGDIRKLNGSIDEVRIYNRSLSANEIKELYASNLQKYNSGQWYFTSNQENLSVGTYSYFASAKDTAGNETMSETRTITISSPGCVGSSCDGGDDGGGGGGGGGGPTPSKNKTNVTIKSNISQTPVVNKTVEDNKSIEIPISNPPGNNILGIISVALNYVLGIIFLTIIIILILLLIKDRKRRISEYKIKSDKIEAKDDLDDIDIEDNKEDDFSFSDDFD